VEESTGERPSGDESTSPPAVASRSPSPVSDPPVPEDIESDSDLEFSDEEPESRSRSRSKRKSKEGVIQIFGLDPDKTLEFDEALLSEENGFLEFDVAQASDHAMLLSS